MASGLGFLKIKSEKKGGIFLTRIEVRRDEPIDKALRKFKSKLRKEGLLEEMKRREFYEKPSQKKRRVLAQAIKREKRRQREADFQ